MNGDKKSSIKSRKDSVMTTGYKEFNNDGHSENNAGKKVAKRLTKHSDTSSDHGSKGSEASIDMPPKISMVQLFRFADGWDYLLMCVGFLCAWASGLCTPIMTILFGNLTNSLVEYGATNNQDPDSSCGSILPNVTLNHSNFWRPNMTDDDFMDSITDFGVGLSILGVMQLVFSYVMVACMNAAAENQIYRIRNLFLGSVLKQDITWYDTHQTGEFASRTSDDLAKLQDGIGEKIGMFTYFIATFIFSMITAFLHGWELTLVMLSVMPLLVIVLGALGKVNTTLAENQLKAYATAGTIAEESITAIRTVVAFGGEKKEAEKYNNNLGLARAAGIRRGLAMSLGSGSLWLVIYGSMALAFWYGIKLILDSRFDEDPKYDPSNLITIFFSVLMGAMNMGQSSPYIEAFSQAQAAAAKVYEIIDRTPDIDSSSEEGRKPEELTGDIEFEDVHFNYPSRPHVTVLNGLSLKINKGQTVALVGESGCGKSTTVQLLQRFYDPAQGTVKLDGQDIRTLNVGWLRDHIGVVGQEPILFGTTISENIRYGRQDATQEDIEKAAKDANAHNFIMKLPMKYDTLVGDRGAQLSGGQKQRVAIARALIKNPQILLLDEATSALDSESEAVVQEALDKARQGRTTIIIAHRLSTIRNADRIASFSEGKIVELGSHEELMAQNGIYHLLVTTQTRGDPTFKVNDGGNLKEADSKQPMLEWQRSMSISSANSVEEITANLASLARVGSMRSKKVGEILLAEELEVESSVDPMMHPSLWKVIQENKPEYHFIGLGLFGALGMGFSSPAFSLLFGDIVGTMGECDADQVQSDSVFYSCMFLLLGFVTGFFMFLQFYSFTFAGERLTERLRVKSFDAIMKQELGFFDDVQNSVGALCTRLSSDASAVQGATGSRIGTIVQAFCTLGASTIIAFILCWQLSLVSMCFMPFILVAAFFQGRIIRHQSMTEMLSLDDANKIAIEAISNIRTVASLHMEAKLQTLYKDFLLKPHKEALRASHIRGFVYGFSQSIQFFDYAATMYYGGILMINGTSTYDNVFKVAELLIVGTRMVGSAFAFAPNATRGMLAASRIFVLLERKPKIDSSLESGLRLPDDTPGLVQFRNVKFNYPTRKDVAVLRDLSLTINPGNVVALVGSSGCGKSTCIQLLERFYDPAGGCVAMDDKDISELNIQWLRSRIGIVSQEPMLFARSIAENIAYGDNTREAGMDEIIQAAINANIHNFITTLPQGYETSVGDKGTQLSGGQKQRIAIARALLRNPKILLLDEATSALDTESEKVVQEALEQAQKGRTCITVAHRLSTIKDADQIAVIDQGKVVEIGTHDELIAKKGHYYKFYKTQSKGHS